MRLIDADALIEYCNNQKVKTVSANDIARFGGINNARTDANDNGRKTGGQGGNGHQKAKGI
jgi:hypothetical protein